MRQRPERFALPVLLLSLIALTGARVFTAALWGDELRTWRDGIEEPLRSVLAWQHNPDHAPLGHLMARAGATLFGVQHAWALRLGSWLCALACVPALWWAGRTLSIDGKRRTVVGLVVAAMFVVDPTATFQATQARMYSALLLMASIALALAGSVLSRPRHPWPRTIGLALAIGVGLWTHSQMYAIVTALLLTTLGVTAARSIRAHRFVASGLPLLVAVALGLTIAAPSVLKLVGPHNVLVDANDESPTMPVSQLEDAAKRLSGEGWITAVLVAATIGGLYVLARRRPAVAALLGLTVLAALTNLLIAARYRAVGEARYLTIAQPALWVAIASLVVALIAAARTRPAQLAIGACVLALGMYEFTRAIRLMSPYPLAAPFRDAMRFVAERRGPDARILVLPRQPFSVYARYYDVRVDAELREEVNQRMQPPRRVTTRPSTQPIDDVWIVGVVTRDRTPRSAADNPIAVIERLTGTPRGSLETSLQPVGGAIQRVFVYRIDAGEPIQLDGPWDAR